MWTSSLSFTCRLFHCNYRPCSVAIHPMKFLAPWTASLLFLSTRLSAFVPTSSRTNTVNTVRPAFALRVATTTAPPNMTHSNSLASPDLLEFPKESLDYDTYSGVILHVQHLDDVSPLSYARTLDSSLELWKMEQRRGIWIHIPKSHGHLIAVRNREGGGCTLCAAPCPHFHRAHRLFLSSFTLAFTGSRL